MTDAGRPNILVVDDEQYICNIIEESLSTDKYNTTALTDPKEALEYIENNPIDLVLTDLVMVEYSGVQILEAAQANHKDAIILLMTAHPTVQTAISVLKKGGYDFLIKPFKLEQLKAAIQRGLEHQRIRRDNLTLQGQVEFLKIVNATGVGVKIDKFLSMVTGSCRKELSAEAVGIILIDPDTRDTVRKVIDRETSPYREEVLDEGTILKFAYTRSAQPNIQAEQIIRPDNRKANKLVVSQPIFVRRKLHGVINLVVIRRFDEIPPGQLDVLAILTNAVASAVANHKLYHDLRASYLQAIKGLANAVEARDAYTAGHTDRVCRLAELVARQMGWDEARIQHLIMGCTLHDMGKIGVPDSVLNKPGKLTDEERQLMQNHPNLGLKIIRGIDLFKPAIPFIIAHHEHYDGCGYPRGLKGERIPVEGRLLAVVDTFDAILSDRPYRRGASLQVAVSELVTNRGTQFDPVIVDTFMDLLRKGRINLREMYACDQDPAGIEVPEDTKKVRV